MTSPRLLSRIAAAFDWFARIGPRMAAMERLSALSDAELARRGTSRAAELHRILP